MKNIVLIISFLALILPKPWDIETKRIDEMVQASILQKIFPGCVIAVYQQQYDEPLYLSYGKFEYPGDSIQTSMDKDTIFDIASVTKVVSATTAAMLLYSKGLLDLDQYLVHYLPQFSNNGKDKIKIRNLLLHNSGFQNDAPIFPNMTKQQLLQWLFTCSMAYPVGQQYVYSDLSMVALQLVIEKISGVGLDLFVKSNVFDLFGMTSMYNPPKSLQAQIPPTLQDNYSRHRLVWGEVNDPTAYVMGGVSGNAGLFSKASDLVHLMQAWLGQYSKSIGKDEILKYWTQRVFILNKLQLKDTTTPYINSRALGWDTVPIQQYPPCGHKFSINSFGHTGQFHSQIFFDSYTGTSVWADRDKNLVIVILTNRVYPNDSSSIVKFRSEITDLILELMGY